MSVVNNGAAKIGITGRFVVNPLLRALTRFACCTWCMPLLILLIAFAVRFHDLDAQSLWNDEGNSLRLAQRGVSALIDAAGRDIHPPGYYLLLKAWIGAAGTSAFALRALSALEGALAVAVTMALGRALFSRGAGLLAGVFVALSPLAVYYSQETRMYAQLELLSAASMWAFVLWIKAINESGPHPLNPPLRHSQRGGLAESAPLSISNGEGLGMRPFFPSAVRLSILLGVCHAAGLYTQYSYPFTMLAQGVLFAAWGVWALGRRRSIRRALIAYLGLHLLALVLFLPWLPTAWDQVTTWPRTGIALALSAQLRTVATWITYGSTAGNVDWVRFLWPGALVIAALWPLRDRRPLPEAWRAALPLVWGAVVIGALFASGAYRPANLKFLLPAQIAAALLMGAGAIRLWETQPPAWVGLTPMQGRSIARMLAVVCAVLVISGQADALHALYADPAYARPDYRAIAAAITADARPGDAIILDAPNQAEIFSYYYRGDAPVYGLPRGLGGDDAQTRADVEAVLSDHRRVFAVLWGEDERDPHRIVAATLDAGAYPVASTWYGDVRLALYAVPDAAPAAPDVATEARFGDTIRLTGYALRPAALQPGDVLGVTLFWTADAPLSTRYKVTVQLLAPDGHLVAQHDAEPANNRAPTSVWTPGDTVIDPHGLVIPPDLPPGEYALVVGLYALDAPSERLPVSASGVPPGDVFMVSSLRY